MNTTTATEVLELEASTQPDQPLTVQHGAIANTSPAGMMLEAMGRGASLEQIEKMMELQERWERREAEKAFREDFAAFRGENIIIVKTKHVDRGRGGSFMQAEYDKVCNRLSPALSAHGFSFRHDQKFGLHRMMIDGIENDVGWVWVTCFLEHRKGHAETLTLEGPPADQSVNSPTQNMQVTASYLKRQSLLAITGTATGGEDSEEDMRGEGATADGGAQWDEALAAGRDAAMQGTEALTKWWGTLGKDGQKALQREFGEMRKAARAADHA